MFKQESHFWLWFAIVRSVFWIKNICFLFYSYVYSLFKFFAQSQSFSFLILLFSLFIWPHTWILYQCPEFLLFAVSQSNRCHLYSRNYISYICSFCSSALFWWIFCLISKFSNLQRLVSSVVIKFYWKVSWDLWTRFYGNIPYKLGNFSWGTAEANKQNQS